MTQIIDTLQLLADLDMRASLSLSEFTLRDWLETMPNTVRELIQRRGHTLIRDYDTLNPVTLFGDFYLLRAALQQIVQNAALYTPEGGTITIHAAHADGMVTVTVSDTGVGIAPDALESIFMHFTKLNTAQADYGNSAGIGLSIAKKVTEMHGGSITAVSQSGQGNAFRIQLPLRAHVPPGVDFRIAAE